MRRGRQAAAGALPGAFSGGGSLFTRAGVRRGGELAHDEATIWHARAYAAARSIRPGARAARHGRRGAHQHRDWRHAPRGQPRRARAAGASTDSPPHRICRCATCSPCSAHITLRTCCLDKSADAAAAAYAVTRVAGDVCVAMRAQRGGGVVACCCAPERAGATRVTGAAMNA